MSEGENIKVIIPAAGYATRLYPLTFDTPKHLLDVAGKPIIEHVINKVIELEDADKIFIITNNKYYPNFKEWMENFSCKVPIKLINDYTVSNDDRLGQIGDIQFVIEKENIKDELLVVAGDNLFSFSLKDSYKTFKKEQKILNALHDVKSIKQARELGIAILNNNNRIIEFQEKSPNPKSTLASLGIYYFKKEHLAILKNYIEQGNNPDKMGYFMHWLIQNNELIGHVYKEKWFDIGWKESLEEARRVFKQ